MHLARHAFGPSGIWRQASGCILSVICHRQMAAAPGEFCTVYAAFQLVLPTLWPTRRKSGRFASIITLFSVQVHRFLAVFRASFMVIHYSLNRYPSGPENWPFFQRSHMYTWQCCTLKCSATHPAFSPVRNVTRLFYFILFCCCAQWSKISSSRCTADENGGHWQFKLWVNGLVN